MRIHELAKELNLTNKDVLARAQALGFDVTIASNSISDGEAEILKNQILAKAKPTRDDSAAPKATPKRETTIVRVKPKIKDSEKKADVHTTKKANVKLPSPPKPRAKTQENAPETVGKGEARPALDERPSAGASPAPRTSSGGFSPAPAPRAASGAPAPAPRVASMAPAPTPAPRAASSAPAPKPRVSAGAPTPSTGAEAGAKGGTVAAEPRKRKPVLKVAYTDQEPEPKPEAVKPVMPTEEVKAAESERKVETPPADTAADKPADKPAEKQEAPKKAAEPKPAKANAEPTGKVEKKTTTAADAKKGDKATKETKKPEKDGEKAKKSETAAKGKDKEKKGHKAKEQKGDSFGDKNRRHNVRSAKRRGPTEDFRGSKRTPILEDSSLEKKPLKSGRRPKSQTKGEIKPTFNIEDLEPGTKIITVPITVAGFAEQIEKTPTEAITALMGMGIMMNINSNLDETTAILLGEELGVPVFIARDEGEIVEEGIEDFEDDPDDLEPRPPIITVMGHVDHGKTSLLDAIRETNVTEGEAGGITQHIGASEAHINGQRIVFLDTPGHEAFTAMRARGAHATDIAVLVVAADDGVMPQTLESISHAKAAGVPVIVAINKIDREGANPDRVKQELSEHGILVEDWGGDTQCVNVSAKSRQGINELLEAILLQAEVLELKANPNRLALGTVIEARLDKSRGSVATLLVLNGTLETGMSIVAGTTSGRIRAMTDYIGKDIKTAGPATAVEVTGLSEVPQAGDEFNAVRDDRTARVIAEGRKLRQRDEIMSRTSGASLDTLFERMGAGETKDLNVIIKGDVQGSVGALTASLEKLSNEEVKINIVHRGVGAVNESDVMLAETSSAVIIGFNVRPGSSVTSLAERDGVEIRTYRVIYDAINDVEAAMKGMLDPEFREVVLGKIEIRDTFKIPGVGTIGGAYVIEGKVQRSAEVRIVRDGIVIHEGKISSLKRFKDDVREVATGYECGIGIENYNDIKEGDIVEAFVMEEIER